MSEYLLIQDKTMSDMANQIRRISGNPRVLNGAEILEFFSRTQGTVKTSGKYEVKAVDANWNVVKSGNYDTGEIFAFPIYPIIENMYFQGWTSSSLLNKNYVVINNFPVTIGAVCAPIDDVFIIQLNITEENTEFQIGLGPRYMEDFRTPLTINWGDGIIENFDEYQVRDVVHTYNNTGIYYVKIVGKIHTQYSDAGTGYPRYPLVYSNYAEIVEKIVLPTYITDIPEYYFEDCTLLKNIVLHNNVKNIRAGAFYDCASIEHIIIPSSVKNIGEEAFYRCEKMKNIILPYGIAKISKNCFRQCISIEAIELPNTIQKIEESAFYYCRSIKSVVITNITSVIDMDADVFANTPIANGTGYIYVPDSLVDSYKVATNWSTYASQIKPLSEYVEE